MSATEGKTSHAVTAEADRAGRGAHPPCVCLSVRVSPLTVLEPGGRGPFNSSPPPAAARGRAKAAAREIDPRRFPSARSERVRGDMAAPWA